MTTEYRQLPLMRAPDHIEAAYLRWRAENPAIMDAFRRFAREAARTRAHYGVKSIAERVRWHLAVESNGDAFKMNNNFTALLARDLMAEGVVPPDFFETRERRAV